jgi:flagellar basal-body rod modification protein FlgD
MDVLSVLNNQTVIQSTGIDTSAQTDAEIAAADAEQQKVDFLELLLTQLQNQNPLDPMDTDEWTAQLTRYSQLEQQISTNEKLTVTNSLLADGATSSAFGFIGQGVEINSNIGVVQDGEASWTYEVQGQSDEVVISITDGDGNVIRTEDGSTVMGVHAFTLDANDIDELGLTAGQQLTMNVAAKLKGSSVNTETTSHVEVDGVWSDQKESFLTAGEISFRMTDVLKVQKPYTEEATVAMAQE